VPADDSLRLDDDEDLGPAGPTTAQPGPEKSVQPVQDGPRPFALKHRDLLSEGEDLKSSITAAARENSERGKKSEEGLQHEPYSTLLYSLLSNTT
jgi:hypothetical protein